MGQCHTSSVQECHASSEPEDSSVPDVVHIIIDEVSRRALSETASVVEDGDSSRSTEREEQAEGESDDADDTPRLEAEAPEVEPFATRRFRRFTAQDQEDIFALDSSWSLMNTSDHSDHCRRRPSIDPSKEDLSGGTNSTVESSEEIQDMSFSGRIPEEYEMNFSSARKSGDILMSSWSEMDTSMAPHTMRTRVPASSDPSSRCNEESMNSSVLQEFVVA